MVLSQVWLFILPMSISVKHLVVGISSNLLASRCIVLLCQSVLRLIMCLFVQHDRKWRHLSLCCDVHRLHKGDMSCLRMYYYYVVFLRICPYQNLRACVICVLMIQKAFQKRLNHLIGGWVWRAICTHRGVCILLEILVHCASLLM